MLVCIVVSLIENGFKGVIERMVIHMLGRCFCSCYCMFCYWWFVNAIGGR